MIIDVRTWTDAERERYRGSCVFVNGCEVPKVWYVDTDAGIVKTYAVLFDATAELIRRVRAWTSSPGVNRHSVCDVGWFPLDVLPPEYEIEAPDDGAVSRTLRGAVRVELSD
jgi:hypothetical protein